MAVIEGGVSGALAEVGVGAAIAQHVTVKPIPTTLGHYRLGVSTGILPAALAANSEIFQFRYSGVNLAVILKLKVFAAVSTTMFAAGVPVALDLVKAINWTGQGTLGTGITVGADLKMRENMASSGMIAGDIRVSTTAALGAGTKTLQANALSTILAGGPITASLNGTIFPETYLFDHAMADGNHPLTLQNNEGFVVRSVAVPATGTWRAAFTCQWMETTIF